MESKGIWVAGLGDQEPELTSFLVSALGSLRNDPVETIQSLVSTLLKNTDEYVKPESVYISRMSQLRNSVFGACGRKVQERKKRLFKTIQRERGVRKRKDEVSQKKKTWSWLQEPLNSLYNRHNGRVQNSPLAKRWLTWAVSMAPGAMGWKST